MAGLPVAQDGRAPAVEGQVMRRLFRFAILQYQRRISAGRNLCSQQAPYNCSNRVLYALDNYGTLVALLMLPSALACSDGPGDRRDYG